YPAATRAGDLVSMLLTAQDQIRKECEVQVGLAAHCGHFFRLGGGLYGADADRVETVSESYTEGGEVVVTAELAAQFAGAGGFSMLPRGDMPAALGANLRVTAGPRRNDLDPRNTRYPIPYSDQFYTDLLRFAGSPDDSQL